ncbi:hypothetical protein JW711_04805 [Candidatus Woesearchaeota archaeon]|nr:hypothetical protein [Candidatus Woesearchaeota archaeon]
MRLRRFGFMGVCALIVMMMFLLSACSKAECEVAKDCGTNSKCITYTCTADQTCKKNVKPNCCGNNLCEDKAGENGCNCDDCKPCESQGLVKYNVTTTRGVKTIESKYARYVCDADQCVIGVSESDANELKLTGTVEERNLFRIDVLSTFNSPFNVAKDDYAVRLRLEDLNPEKVSGGLTITKLQVLNKNYVMGEKLLSKQLNKVGDLFEATFSLTSAQTLVEEETTLTLSVDYSYLPIDSRGEVIPVKRDSQQMTITSAGKVFVIKPD